MSDSVEKDNVYRIYLSSSSQEHNIGINGYGTEEENMFNLISEIAVLLLDIEQIQFVMNTPSMGLAEEVAHCNSLEIDLYLSNHSNATGSEENSAEGCEVYYHTEGEDFANILYNYISKVSDNDDRGVKQNKELYVLRNTKAPAVLVEHFFHDNAEDVAFFQDNIHVYAVAVVKALCEYFDIVYEVETRSIQSMINELQDEVKTYIGLVEKLQLESVQTNVKLQLILELIERWD